MPIGTLNEAQYGAHISLVQIRLAELVRETTILEVSGANSVRSGKGGSNIAPPGHGIGGGIDIGA